MYRYHTESIITATHVNKQMQRRKINALKKKKIINKIHQISWRDTICKLSNLKKKILST